MPGYKKFLALLFVDILTHNTDADNMEDLGLMLCGASAIGIKKGDICKKRLSQQLFHSGKL